MLAGKTEGLVAETCSRSSCASATRIKRRSTSTYWTETTAVELWQLTATVQ